MRKNPRSLFWLIVLLTVLSVFINLPKFNLHAFNKNINFDTNSVLKLLKINKELTFRKGLDLEGGTSLVLRADVSDISSSQRNAALDSAKTVIEKRVNLFGVSEPIVQTSVVGNNDYRIIVELPGLTDINQVRTLIGTTAQLSFWEQIGTKSATLNLVDFKKTNLTGA